MSTESYTLLPVSSSQRTSFNIKELNKNSERFFTEAAKTIYALEEISEERVLNLLKDTFKGVYFTEEENKKKAKSEKKEQPPSCYILFCKDRRPRITEENPDADAKRIIELLASAWKEISEEEKKVYIDRANAIKQQIKDGTYVAPVKEASAAKPKAGSKRPATEELVDAAPAPKKKDAAPKEASVAKKKDAAPKDASPAKEAAPKKATASKK